MGPGGPGPRGPGGPGGRGPGRPGGPRGKRKGNWWRHWTWKKAGIVAGSLIGLFILLVFGGYEYLSSSATIPPALASANYQDTIVYYADGKTPIGTIGTVDRQNLTYQEIPKPLQNAVVAAEDKNFWTEGGISPTGILRAAMHDLTSSGGSLNGGSTITQEFVRGYYDGIGTQQTTSRKIKEIFVAQKVAATESKQWILTNYLNLIYLGDGAYGVAAAAQTYFGVPVSQLSIAQDAVIAGIIQQPSLYPLKQYRSDLTARWQYVLDQEVKDGYITQAQADAAVFPKLQTDSTGAVSGVGVTENNNDPWAPYLMDVVENELETYDKISTQTLETGGLRVVTTISRPMEAEMYSAVNQNIAAIKADGGTIPSYIRIGAEVQNPGNGEILATYPGPGQGIKNCQEYDCDEDMAVYAREQVGSSFKPYVLSAAVAQGMNVQTSILNAAQYLCVPPVTLGSTLSKDMSYYTNEDECAQNGLSGYFPVENDGGEQIGSAKNNWGVSPQTALAQSSNTAFTDLAHRVGTQNIVNMAAQFGVDTQASGLDDMGGEVGMALGIGSLTVNEQATMLSTIDDNGVYHQAHIVKYWQVAGDGTPQKAHVASHQVLTPQQDSEVQYAMEMTTVNGTGTAAGVGLGNRQIIAKTGTTSSYHSGFFIGAIPQYSMAVGIFTASQNDNDTSQSLLPLGGGGFGGYWPAKIWNTFALAEFANLPSENFQSPDFFGAKWVQVAKLPPKQVTCRVDGKKVKITLTGKIKGCPKAAPKPTPAPTPSNSHRAGGPTASPSPSPTFSLPGFPSVSASPSPSPTPTAPSASGSTTPTGTPSPTAPAAPPTFPGIPIPTGKGGGPPGGG
jgi:membrane peptidoglycan carboxypeptidase